MGVAELLEIDDVVLEGVARDRWPGWAAGRPHLAGLKGLVLGPPGLPGLRRWLWAHRAAGNGVLLELAELASAEDGDDLDAARLLAWVVLPGAITTARRFAGPGTDRVVASTVFEGVRTVPWRRGVRVAPYLSWPVWTAAQQHVLGRDESARGVWRHVLLVDSEETLDRCATAPAPAHGADDSIDELGRVLARAVTDGVITRGERHLLGLVVEAMAQVGRKRCGVSGGLSSVEVATLVSAQVGLSAQAIRHRVTRCLHRLRQHRVELCDAWN